MNSHLVSVIIPTYNRQDLILQTVRSVLQQSYQNIEVIIISDGGTDETEKVLSQIDDKRWRYIHLNKNTGLPAVARNVGIEESKGSYIAFCDDDDLWFKEKLETQIGEIEHCRPLLAVATNTVLYPTGRLNSFFLTRDVCIGYHRLLSSKGNPICTSTVLLKKEAIDRVGLFDESPELRGYEDFDLWLRILKYQDFSLKILKRASINYRVNNIKLILSDEFEMLNEIKSLKFIYEKHLPGSRPLIELISNNNQYEKVHHLARVSMKLCFGALSFADILKDNKMTVIEKSGIMIKYLFKKFYFYYFNLLSV